MVLCHLCYKAGLTFSIAHCNFKLRGAESTRDEKFVTALAEKYKVPFYLKRFDTDKIAEEEKLSIQEMARKLRYDWFNEILNGQVEPKSSHTGQGVSDAGPLMPVPNYLLTAHHLDDNIETVLMNFFKGTGISGLRGIRPKSGSLIRPLLFTKRKEIEAYANENGLAWVNDSSNDETKYTRNYFRHTIIPAIEKVFPEASSNMAQNIQRFSEIEFLYQQAIQVHKSKLLTTKGAEAHIPVLKLKKASPIQTIVYEIIKEYGFSNRQVNEVIKLLNGESGKYVSSQSHRILRNRNWLIISPLHTDEHQIIIIEEGQAKAMFNDHLLNIRQMNEGISIHNNNNIAVLDARDIKYPLLLRKWKPGDYFYPLGMSKKKKLSRFFIDMKLSKGEKEAVWVIESAKKIIWVVGLRIDDRFKITPSTSKAIELQVNRL